MDLLPCVRSSIQGKAAKLTVAMAVLAFAFAAPAFGTITYLDPNQTDTCSVGVGTGSCALVWADAGAPGGDPNMNWLQLYGTGNSAFVEDGGHYVLSFSASGGSDNSAFPAGSIPDSWNFTVNSASVSPITWTVSFTMGVSGNYQGTTDTGSVAPGTNVTGSDLITFGTGGTVGYYYIGISLSSASPFSVSVPAGSTIDLNPASVSVPEPGSMWLVAAGAACLPLRRKWRS
jgi:hypothetical protein